MQETILLDKLSLIEAKNKYVNKKHRIFEIDFIRGILIIGMVLDHIIGDFFFLFPYIFSYTNAPDWAIQMQTWSTAYWDSDWRKTIRYVGLMLFLLLSGISCSFAKNNIKRGLFVTGLGILVTIGTISYYSLIYENPEQYFRSVMGALSTIGLCILLFTLCKIGYIALYNVIKKKKFLKEQKANNPLFKEKYQKVDNPKSWIFVCLGITLILFGLTIYIKFNDDWTTSAYSSLDLSKRWWFVLNGDYTYYLSTLNFSNNPDRDTLAYQIFMICIGAYRYGVDWLGFFPYVFYFFLGGFIGETVYRNRESVIRFFFYRHRFNQDGEDRSLIVNDELNRWFSPIICPGRVTIWIYLLHQLIIPITVWGLFSACGMEVTL